MGWRDGRKEIRERGNDLGVNLVKGEMEKIIFVRSPVIVYSNRL
jgi:hypothetical protein